MSIVLGAAVLMCGAFGPETFSADEGCGWTVMESAGLRMNAAFIAGPLAGEDRVEWLERVREYRRMVREGGGTPLLAMTFGGVRAWVRMARPLAGALALVPGETMRVEIEARWIEGNDTLCLAFDQMDASGEHWVGWSGVKGTVAIPRDGEWHRLECVVRVPEKGRGEVLRPIVGMDATQDKTPGRVEIRAIDIAIEDAERMDKYNAAIEKMTARRGLDLSIYDRPHLIWASGAFTCHFTFMYDKSFYDGTYRVDDFLDEGEREFGGYDAIVLWHAYPRIGIDDRNQFDFYRDMPGGLAGLRDVVKQFHYRRVKVFIDYNPWDTGTRRSGVPDEQAIAEIVKALEADGVFLDTMVAAPTGLRAAVDAVRPGVAFEPEGQPAINELSVCSASWAQWLQDPAPPGMLHLKWLEPRHMQHQIRRWNTSHAEEIETAFFNGSGMLVWENVFGTYNPWSPEDKALWRKAVPLLRAHKANLVSDRWEPFHLTRAQGLYAHRWPGEYETVYTMTNKGQPLRDAELFEAPADAGTCFFDGWNDKPMRVEARDGTVKVFGDVERLGFVIQSRRAWTGETESHDEDTPRMKGLEKLGPAELERERKGKEAAAKKADTSAMVRVEGGKVRMRLEHMRRECGCYADPGTPPDRLRDFEWGSPFDGTLNHDYEVEVAPFLIDECEVSNAQFKRFLDKSGYEPQHPENFLKHWPGGKMPEKIAELPVVYVDLDDARAYAAWAGKRLPTEPEWQLAAQGKDGRLWPWGNEFDGARCTASGGPVAVRSMPEGKSPCSCYHMSGNVWEWTDSERNNGHTRFCIVRGGSWYKAEGSIWYMPGGPQPNTSHAKFILMWPGLDRCATIGFRCVK